jgi:1-deoxy-D-xylulose-5-phosphate synthase
VFVPRDEAELQRLLATALQLDGPSVIRYPRSAGLGVPLTRPIVPLAGPWVETVREGSGVLLLAVGPSVRLAEAAGDTLAKEGILATVAAVRRVHPLDMEALRPLLRSHTGVVTLEDNALAGGFGSAILEAMAEEELWRPTVRLGLPDAFVGQGALELLRRDVGLTPDAVVEAARRLLRRTLADAG